MCVTVVVAGLAVAGQGAESAPAAPPLALQGMVPSSEGALVGWLGDLRERHPELQSARARAVAARRSQEAVSLDFRDPDLSASAGYSDGPGDAPHVTLPRVLPADAFTAQGGIEAPLGAGLYGGVGVSQRQVEVEGSDGRDGQSLVGGRIRLPLMRDRGYRVMRLEEALREAETIQAESEVARAEAVRVRDVVLAYAGLLQTVAEAREVDRAMLRAEKLLEETSARADLQVVAEYQVFPARYEAALRREELESSRQQIVIQARTLGERLGGLSAPDPAAVAPEELLVRWAEALVSLATPATELPGALERRGEYRQAQARALAAEAALQSASEALKDDLSLRAGASWDQGAEEEDGDGTSGYEVAVAYSRTLGRRGEKARLAAAWAELDARRSDLTLLEVQVSAEIARALASWDGARNRLALAQGAVVEARRVLAAEDERFALGEGTSRNVLDAQKDLTTATRRSVTVAGQVVTAMAELRHALGLPLDADGQREGNRR